MSSNELNLLTDTIYQKLPDITIAIIGLGGVGSVLCQSLAHVGVRKFILIDDDVVENSNLIKLVGAGPKNIGEKKHKVITDMIDNIAGIHTNPVIVDKKYLLTTKNDIDDILKNVNFVFCSVDRQNGREQVNSLCVRNRIPFIDCGVGMAESDGVVKDIVGQTIMVLPGWPCLQCFGKQDTLSYRDKKIPYIQINSIIANLAVMEFVKYISDFAENYHMIYYSMMNQNVESMMFDKSMPKCSLCRSIYCD